MSEKHDIQVRFLSLAPSGASESLSAGHTADERFEKIEEKLKNIRGDHDDPGGHPLEHLTGNSVALELVF